MAYRVGIDVGGTFTDLALIDDVTGQIYTTKSSSTPGDPIAGVMAVIDKLHMPKEGIDILVHGTTVGTNALLERKGARTALLTTQGFRDVIFIQRMNRKHHYDLRWDKPVPLTERRYCYEVKERINHKGEEVEPLDEEGARMAVRAMKAEGIEAIAVALLFAYVNPAHELRLREIICEEYPGVTVSLSHEVYPRWREYDRMSTTIADAYLKPLVSSYMSNLDAGLKRDGVNASFLIMKSNGGVEDHQAASDKPVDLLMSGPVGGVLSALYLGKLTNRPNLVAVDMGGTSFDVSLIANGEVNRTTEFELEWGLPVSMPMVDVKSIGAGGGSLAWIDKGGLLRVGPQSAGARPGPACYGRGGTEATVTDANLVLGRLNPDYFLGGEMSLDVEAAREAVGWVAGRIGMGLTETAQVIVDLVDHNMVNAIRLVSIDRGLDPRNFTLVSFGGAGSNHAASLAEIIGIREVLVPIHQGVFSAFGLTIADMRVDESQTAAMRSDLLQLDHLNEVLKRLSSRAFCKIAAEGYKGKPEIEAFIEMRYLGQNYGSDIPVPTTEGGQLGREHIDMILESFHEVHRRLYGYTIPDEVIEFVNFKVTAVGRIPRANIGRLPTGGAAEPKQIRPVYFKETKGWVDCPIYNRETLPAGVELKGPAVIEEAMATSLLLPGETLKVDEYGNLFIRTTVA